MMKFALNRALNWGIAFLSIGVLACFGVIMIWRWLAPPEYFPPGQLPEKYRPLEGRAAPALDSVPSGREDSLAILRQLSVWVNGLGRLNLPLYLSTYSTAEFSFSGGGYDAWREKKSAEFSAIQAVNLKISEVDIRLGGALARVQFRQVADVDGRRTESLKVQRWVKTGGVWLINREGVQKPQVELGTGGSDESSEILDSDHP